MYSAGGKNTRFSSALKKNFQPDPLSAYLLESRHIFFELYHLNSKKKIDSVTAISAIPFKTFDLCQLQRDLQR